MSHNQGGIEDIKLNGAVDFTAAIERGTPLPNSDCYDTGKVNKGSGDGLFQALFKGPDSAAKCAVGINPFCLEAETGLSGKNLHALG